MNVCAVYKCARVCARASVHVHLCTCVCIHVYCIYACRCVNGSYKYTYVCAPMLCIRTCGYPSVSMWVCACTLCVRVCTEHACVNGGLCVHMAKGVLTSDPVPSTLYLPRLRSRCAALNLRKLQPPMLSWILDCSAPEGSRELPALNQEAFEEF